MSSASAELTFRPRGNGCLCLGLCAIAGAAGTLITVRGLPLPILLTGWASLAAPCLEAWRSHRGLRMIRRCQCYPDGRGLVSLQDGRTRLAWIEPALVHPALVILTLQTADAGRYRVFLPRGAIRYHAHRRLRAWLHARTASG